MQLRDAGLADDYWKRYFSPEEVEAILATVTTTTIVSGHLPIHLRLYAHPRPAPTILYAHGAIQYGLMMAHLHLAFHRAGFNVVNWDLPGFGLSGGPRDGATADQFITTWKDVIAFACGHFGDPLYIVGNAEDAVAGYYAAANLPVIRAMSLHNLFELGDPDIFNWQGPRWLTRLQMLGLPALAKVAPTFGFDPRTSFPWEALFSYPDDAPRREVFDRDPLRIQRYGLGMALSMARRTPPSVPFEACRTPIQLVVSRQKRVWSYEMNVRSFDRLGGPKEFITLEEGEQWSFNREFGARFTGHAARWFVAQGARPVTPIAESVTGVAG